MKKKNQRNYENMSKINQVAIIMDGNGWLGIKKYNSRKIGHQKGIKIVEKIIEASIKKKN